MKNVLRQFFTSFTNSLSNLNIPITHGIWQELSEIKKISVIPSQTINSWAQFFVIFLNASHLFPTFFFGAIIHNTLTIKGWPECLKLKGINNKGKKSTFIAHKFQEYRFKENLTESNRYLLSLARHRDTNLPSIVC